MALLSNVHVIPTRNPKKVRVNGVLTDPHPQTNVEYHGWTVSGEGASLAAATKNAEREAVAFLASLG